MFFQNKTNKTAYLQNVITEVKSNDKIDYFENSTSSDGNINSSNVISLENHINNFSSTDQIKYINTTIEIGNFKRSDDNHGEITKNFNNLTYLNSNFANASTEIEIISAIEDNDFVNVSRNNSNYEKNSYIRNDTSEIESISINKNETSFSKSNMSFQEDLQDFTELYNNYTSAKNFTVTSMGINDTQSKEYDTIMSSPYVTKPYHQASNEITSPIPDTSTNTKYLQTTTSIFNAQRVEISEVPVDWTSPTIVIRWKCPPTSDESQDKTSSIRWLRLGYNIQHFDYININKSVLTIKDAYNEPSGRYACIVGAANQYKYTEHIFYYQIHRISHVWIDIDNIDDEVDDIKLKHRQYVTLQCTRGQIIINNTRQISSSQCNSRMVLFSDKLSTNTTYSCSNDSPRKTISLITSPSSCETELFTCPDNSTSDLTNNCQIPPQTNHNNSSHFGATRIRYYYNSLVHQCIPMMTQLNKSQDNYGYLSLRSCESSCIVIHSDATKCFDVVNKDETAACSHSTGNFGKQKNIGKYMVTFNINSSECDWFYHYIGCKMSTNNFATMKECITKCAINKKMLYNEAFKICKCNEFGGSKNLSEICRIGCKKNKQNKNQNQSQDCQTFPLPGICSSQHLKWFYDPQINDCTLFLDGGCGTSYNRFDSHSSCRKACYHTNQSASTTSPLITTPSSSLPTESSSSLSPASDTSDNILPSSRILNWEPCIQPPLYYKTLSFKYGNSTNIRYLFDPSIGRCRPMKTTYWSLLDSHRDKPTGLVLFDNLMLCIGNCENRFNRIHLYSSNLIVPSRCKPGSFKNDVAIRCLLSSPTFDNDIKPMFIFMPSIKQCLPLYINQSQLTDSCNAISIFPSIQECMTLCYSIYQHHMNIYYTPPTEFLLSDRCQATTVYLESCEKHERVTLYTYLASAAQCVAYQTCPITNYKGNVFTSKQQCETTCLSEEVCEMELDPGEGDDFWHMYAFDVVTNNCQLLFYGGSLGNRNRWTSEEECEQVCKPHVSSRDSDANKYDNQVKYHDLYSKYIISSDPFINNTFVEEYCFKQSKYGSCRLSGHAIFVERYYYDIYHQRCNPYFFSGCGSISTNNFVSKDQCQINCEQRIQNRNVSNQCVKPQRSCPGRYSLKSWYYNTENGRCVSYPACNSTSFIQTELECEENCLPVRPKFTQLYDICHMPPSQNTSDNCIHPKKRWYYDKVLDSCVPTKSPSCNSIYGNNFPTYQICELTCKPLRRIDICKLPKDKGSCNATLRYYYFDWSSQICRQFRYSGCLGNRNRFISKSECESICLTDNPCNWKQNKPLNEGQNASTTSNIIIYRYDSLSNQCGPQYQLNNRPTNYNHFITITKCLENCLIPDISLLSTIVDHGSVVRCRLPVLFNVYPLCTKKWLPRYYYDPVKEKCLFYYYNGCDLTADGSANRFISETTCRNLCQQGDKPKAIKLTQLLCPPVKTACTLLNHNNQTCSLNSKLPNRNVCPIGYVCCPCSAASTLCTTPLHCRLTRYGCCSDRITVAIDETHSSCADSGLTGYQVTSVQPMQIGWGSNTNSQSIICTVVGDPRPERLRWLHVATGMAIQTNKIIWDHINIGWSSVLDSALFLHSGWWICNPDEVTERKLVSLKSTLLLNESSNCSSPNSTLIIIQNNITNLHQIKCNCDRNITDWTVNGRILSNQSDGVLLSRNYVLIYKISHSLLGNWKCSNDQSNQMVLLGNYSKKEVILVKINQPIRLLCNVTNGYWIFLNSQGEMTVLTKEKLWMKDSVQESDVGERNSFLCVEETKYVVKRFVNLKIKPNVKHISQLPAGDVALVGDRLQMFCKCQTNDNENKRRMYIVWTHNRLKLRKKGIRLGFWVSSTDDGGIYTCQCNNGEKFRFSVNVLAL